MQIPPPDRETRWFRRTFAITLLVGATIALLLALQPGYAVFFWTSTLTFLLAGLFWGSGSPPRGPRLRVHPAGRHVQLESLATARVYRVSALR
jgi:hypothetical protein